MNIITDLSLQTMPNLIEIEQEMLRFMVVYQPVSYTHLDVYKRQVFRKFVYELQPRDAALFLLYNIITYFIIYYSMGHGYFSGNVNWFNSMIGLSGLLLGCLFLLLFLYQKNSTYLRCQKDIAQQEIRELELKYEYYKEKQKDEEKVRSVYHDMKNHLLVLQKQINSPETAEMVEKLQSQVAM